MTKRAVAILAMALLSAGCFEIDNTIRLERDLSGTADFHLGVDLEPMVLVMAQFAREMEGKSGPATAEEIAKARADFKSSRKTKEGPMPSREEMDRSMPEGVKLLDFKVEDRDFGMVTDFRFAFDRINRLVGVRLPSKEGADPTQKNVVDTPFEGLEVVEEGETVTIRTKPQNPAKSVEEEAAAGAPQIDPETAKLVRDAFRSMRVSYRISAPFAVVSHNATRREGNTLIWEYDVDSLEKAGADAGVSVTYRK